MLSNTFLVAPCSQKLSPKPKTLQKICCSWPLLFLFPWVPARSEGQVWSLTSLFTISDSSPHAPRMRRSAGTSTAPWRGPEEGLVHVRQPRCYVCAKISHWYYHGEERDTCYGHPFNLQALQPWRPTSSYKQAAPESSLHWRCILTSRGHQVGMNWQQAVGPWYPSYQGSTHVPPTFQADTHLPVKLHPHSCTPGFGFHSSNTNENPDANLIIE